MGSHLRWGHAYLCPSFLLSSSSFPDLKQFLNTHTHTHTHTQRAIFHCPSNLDSHIRYNIGSLASLPAVNCVVVREGRCDTREKLAQRGGHNAKRRTRPPKSLEAGQEGIFFVLQGLCHTHAFLCSWVLLPILCYLYLSQEAVWAAGSRKMEVSPSTVSLSQG